MVQVGIETVDMTVARWSFRMASSRLLAASDPELHHGALGQPLLQDLVPAHGVPAFRIQVGRDAVGEVDLQGVLVFQTFLPDAPLAVGAILPALFGRFVSADMDVGGRKEFQHFIEHIFRKVKTASLPAQKDIRKNAKVRGHFKRPAGAGKFGVGGQGGQRMARHFHFRDNGDVAFGRVGHDLPDLSLRVKPAMRNAVMFSAGKTIARPGAL